MRQSTSFRVPEDLFFNLDFKENSPPITELARWTHRT